MLFASPSTLRHFSTSTTRLARWSYLSLEGRKDVTKAAAIFGTQGWAEKASSLSVPSLAFPIRQRRTAIARSSISSCRKGPLGRLALSTADGLGTFIQDAQRIRWSSPFTEPGSRSACDQATSMEPRQECAREQNENLHQIISTLSHVRRPDGHYTPRTALKRSSLRVIRVDGTAAP